MVGVNTKLIAWNSTWGLTQLQSGLITRIRELIAYNIGPGGSGNADGTASVQSLMAKGIRVNFLAGNVDPSLTTPAFYLSEALNYFGPNGIASFEGVNEYDGSPYVPADHVLAFQSGLKAAKQSSQFFAPIPLLTPTFIYDPAPLANGLVDGSNSFLPAASYSDMGNMHSYCNWHAPEVGLPASLHAVSSVVKALPVVATECGWKSGYADTIGPNGVPDAMPNAHIATYIVRLVLYYAMQGINALYLYELLDDSADHTTWDSNWGLYNNDQTVKPQGQALLNLLKAIRDTGYPSIVANPTRDAPTFPASLSGATSNVLAMVLGRSNGTYMLAIWNASEVWDGNAFADVAVPAQTVRIDLPAYYANLAVMQPSGDGIWRSAKQAGDNSLTLAVQPDVKLIWLK